MNQSRTITRRAWVKTAALGSVLGAPLLTGCAGGDLRNPVFTVDVNRKALWARREVWAGPEMVRGVVAVGDTYLLVQYADGNWDFPGGLVSPDYYGPKTEPAKEIIAAAGNYTHSQALIGLRMKDANLFAYGYGIDNYRDENYMIYWVSLVLPTNYPPQLHANMQEAIKAAWVPPDHPRLGKCAAMRAKEFMDANEGNSVLRERCFELM